MAHTPGRGRHRRHAEPVAGDDRRRIRAVEVAVPDGRLARHERDAVLDVDAALQVDVLGIDAGVEHTHFRAFAGRRVLPRVRGVDLPHVPLKVGKEKGAALVVLAGVGADRGTSERLDQLLAGRDELRSEVLADHLEIADGFERAHAGGGLSPVTSTAPISLVRRASLAAERLDLRSRSPLLRSVLNWNRYRDSPLVPLAAA